MTYKLNGEWLPQYIEEYVEIRQDPSGFYTYNGLDTEANPTNVMLALILKIEELETKILNLESRAELLERPISLKFIQDS